MAESKAIIKAMLIGIDFCWRRRGFKGFKDSLSIYSGKKKMAMDKFHFSYAKFLFEKLFFSKLFIIFSRKLKNCIIEYRGLKNEYKTYRRSRILAFI